MYWIEFCRDGVLDTAAACEVFAEELRHLTLPPVHGTRCPAHDDATPSLSIREGNDGRVLVKCHAGCQIADIVAALGMDLRDPCLPTRRHERSCRFWLDGT